jgi:hypothetical protein
MHNNICVEVHDYTRLMRKKDGSVKKRILESKDSEDSVTLEVGCEPPLGFDIRSCITGARWRNCSLKLRRRLKLLWMPVPSSSCSDYSLLIPGAPITVVRSLSCTFAAGTGDVKATQDGILPAQGCSIKEFT